MGQDAEAGIRPRHLSRQGDEEAERPLVPSRLASWSAAQALQSASGLRSGASHQRQQYRSAGRAAPSGTQRPSWVRTQLAEDGRVLAAGAVGGL